MIEPLKVIHVGTFDKGKNKLIILGDQLDLESGRALSHVGYAPEELGLGKFSNVDSIEFKFPLKYIHLFYEINASKPFQTEKNWRKSNGLIDLNFPLLNEIVLSENIVNVFGYYVDKFSPADMSISARGAESELRYDSNIVQRLWFYSNFLLYVNRQCRSEKDYEHIKLKVEEHVLERCNEYQNLVNKVDRLRQISSNRMLTNRKQIPDHVLAFILQRDSNKCVLCGDDSNLQFDHIFPVSKGGNNEPENLRILCQQCNQSRGNLRNA
jgi:5-methylcytosine-specific restriction endonuclease McrA